MCVDRVLPRTQGSQGHKVTSNNQINHSVNHKGMKHLRLILLGSKTVIYIARRLLFTCVMRCHTSSLECKRPKPIHITHQREINLPAKPLANSNVHWLLNPGTYCKNELDVSCVYCFNVLLIFRELKCILDMILQ